MLARAGGPEIDTVYWEMVAGLAQQCTEGAIEAAHPLFGRASKEDIDAAAVNAMWQTLNGSQFHGAVIIGEGEKDGSHFLAHDTPFGKANGGHFLGIAVDPIEGTTNAATSIDDEKGFREGTHPVLSVLAITPHVLREGGVLGDHPESGFYPWNGIGRLNRYVVSSEAREVLNEQDIFTNPRKTLNSIADAYRQKPSELTVVVLDPVVDGKLRRPHNIDLINTAYALGAKVVPRSNGDFAPAVQAALGSGIVSAGIGGSPEAVLAAACIRASGKGAIKAQWFAKDRTEHEILARIEQANDTFSAVDLVGSGPVVVSITAGRTEKVLGLFGPRGQAGDAGFINGQTLVLKSWVDQPLARVAMAGRR